MSKHFIFNQILF